ncbi:hypothetical protein NE237_002523 [Protea cynaroides]|uniref:ALA-interacting subunit n=1 Tax=Protea cynaroides TaxID=273540 RepID=A0A9Q0KVF2_9MAGN|nr:hypothetical protein NE237_002523 [Protea cynaroides]
MDVDGASTSGPPGEPHSNPIRWRNHVLYQFTQQTLPACKPVLTPAWVITVFLLTGIIFIPVGFVAFHASQSVVEIVDRYDTGCIPEKFRSDKVAYIQDDSFPKNCTRVLRVRQHMKAPIYVYYELDNYYQNHRRYVKSRSDKQLLHGLKYNHTSSCQPMDLNNGLPIVPCGLIAWSLFNDTYTFHRRKVELNVDRKNIAWRSDRDHKFGKNVYPFNFQNGSLIGGGKLDASVPLSDQEDLIVWMRTAALPSFRKLYGRIEEDLDADELLVGRKKWVPWDNLHCCRFYFHLNISRLHAASYENSKAIWGHSIFIVEQENQCQLNDVVVFTNPWVKPKKVFGKWQMIVHCISS